MPTSDVTSPHRVCFLIYPGVASYDVAGPAQALALVDAAPYQVSVLSVCGGLIESDCPGLTFGSISASAHVDKIDTLIIPGGIDAPKAAEDNELIETVARLAASARRVATVCTGAFLAAQAGLLVGLRAATHWNYCDLFAERFPDVQLDRDSIWVRDGEMWSSAGVSAGVDLTLAMIEEDQGVAVALQVARLLVVFLKRPGGQSQFSNLLSGQIADADGPLGALFAWIADNLDADLSQEALAKKAGMSLRTFARSCVARTGMTSTKIVEAIRVQAAREAIEQGAASMSVVAMRFGFGDEQRMRRSFLRQTGATPADIRARFRR